MLACPLPPDEALRQQAREDLALVDTPPDTCLDALVDLARKTFGMKTVQISLIDHDRQSHPRIDGSDRSTVPAHPCR
ncbi:hypothetical protein PALA52_02206 [Pseudomonas aeruginosa]|nr:hypothetical protein PALA52_02206 [Pseudomonas aeruginosa]